MQTTTPTPTSVAEPIPPPLAATAEGVSLLGVPLHPPPLPANVEERRTKELADARTTYDANPNDADAIIWLGRRTAYLGRYRESIEIFTEGIRKHPQDARMYRHRGHRYITLRQFDKAIDDLNQAAELTRNKPDEIEPDGLPNARNIPIGSLQSNICYHLGLAHYLKGDFEKALGAYRPCHTLSTNPDRLVSTTHWLYMTLRRLGRIAEATRVLDGISSSMDVIENVSYHKLALMYAGEIAPEELEREDPATTDGATILYGVGNWHLYNGDTARARKVFQRIQGGKQWPAFGHIAAEAELARGVRLP